MSVLASGGLADVGGTRLTPLTDGSQAKESPAPASTPSSISSIFVKTHEVVCLHRLSSTFKMTQFAQNFTVVYSSTTVDSSGVVFTLAARQI